MKTIPTLALLAIFVAFAPSASQAQILATYSVSNDSTADGGYITPSGVDASTVASNDTVGAGIIIDNNFGFGGYADKGDDGSPTPFPTSIADAQADKVYFQFNLAPKAGSVLDITAVDFSTAEIFNYTGDTVNYVYTLRSSADGYATDLGSFSLAGGSIAYGSKLTFATPLVAATDVNFELYITRPGSTQNYSYAYVPLAGSFSVDGTSLSVPEPGTYALLALGLAGVALKLRQRRLS